MTLQIAKISLLRIKLNCNDIADCQEMEDYLSETFTYRQMLNKMQILICFVFFQKHTGDDIDLILDKRHKIFKHFGQ